MSDSDSFLVIFPLDVEVWRNSDSYARLTLQEQGADMNLWFAAWAEQPHCTLPDDDDVLWRRANARSKAQWKRLKPRILEDSRSPWRKTDDGRWIHPVVSESFAKAKQLHSQAVSRGRAGGFKSARVRRAKSKGLSDRPEDSLQTEGKTVSSMSVDRSNPPSPSPSTEQQPPHTPPARGGSSSRAVQAGVDRLAGATLELLGERLTRAGRKDYAHRLRSGESESDIRRSLEDLATELKGST